MQRLRIESGLRKGKRWYTLRLQFIRKGYEVGSEVAYLMDSAEFAELAEFVENAPR